MKNYAKKHFKLFIEEIGKLSNQLITPNGQSKVAQ